MKKFGRYFHLYWQLQLQNIKSLEQYRADFLMMTFFTLLSQVCNLSVLGIIYSNTPKVGGWKVWEILILYGFLLFSEGSVNFFFQGAWKITQMIHKSELDRFLVRPMPVGLQMVTSRIDFDGVNKMGIGFIILTIGLIKCRINCTFCKILYLIISLLLSCLIRFGMIWIASCVSFWTNGTKNSLNYLVLSVGEMAKYPLAIYPFLLKNIFGYLIPYAYISYYPVGYLIGKENMGVGYLMIFPVCIVMIFLSAAVLKLGLDRYESNGN